MTRSRSSRKVLPVVVPAPKPPPRLAPSPLWAALAAVLADANRRLAGEARADPEAGPEDTISR